VCPIEARERKKQHVSSDGREVEKKKEEEVIDCTHKSGLLSVKPNMEKTLIIF
jgi:hypothetical protein